MQHGIQKRDKRLYHNKRQERHRGQVRCIVTYINALIEARNSQFSILRHDDKSRKHTSQKAFQRLLVSPVHGPRSPVHYAARLTWL